MGKEASQAGHGCILSSADEILCDEIEEAWERERFEACETVSASIIGSSMSSSLRLTEDDDDEGESESSRHTRIRFIRREKESDCDCGTEARGFWVIGEEADASSAASGGKSEEQYDEHADSCSSSWSSISSPSLAEDAEDEDEEYDEDAAELEFMTDDILLGGGGETSTS